MAIKPSSHGIVVEHKESGNRYASTDANYDPQTERKVRDLKPGESVLSYPVKPAPDGWQPKGDTEDLITEDHTEPGDVVGK